MSSAVRPSSGGASLSHSRSDSISTSISLPPLPLSRPARRASAGGGILTPARDAELNQPGRRQSIHDQDVFGSRKRKRDVSTPGLSTDNLLLKAPIVLKPHPSSLTSRPCMLHPLMMLPRESLPLSALDLVKPHGELPSTRLFESKIKILDLEGRLGHSVLIARSEITKMVYAVESESPGLYVLCKLGSWVDIGELSHDATVVCKERLKGPKQVKVEDPAGAPLITPQMYKENKRRKLAIEELQAATRRRSGTLTDMDSHSQISALPNSRPASRGIVGSRPASRGVGTQIVQPPEEILADSLALLSSTRDSTPTLLPVSDTGCQAEQQSQPQEQEQDKPTAEGIMDNIRTQYQEALYHSKGSLAYFAKGPLSRARAAFHPDTGSDLEMADLVEFLKSLIMTTILVDKKYRETIPAIIEKMKTCLEDSDNAQTKRKKRKVKKPKMGKDGLYPSEVDHVKRWWTSHLPIAVGNEEEEAKTVSQTEARYHVSCLRRRETQLQMILIMEILALEPLIRPKDPVGDYLLPGESRAPSREASQEPTAKKRNKHNLPVLLDVHADRLCIWQSVTLDEVKALAESQAPKEGARPERIDSDPLKDFCVEIILPFFAARLPELCDSINRKLGGPVAQSPPKKEFVKPTAVSKAKPGAPAKRPAALKKDSDRSLQRALSNERMRRSVSREPSKAIALMRSASATAIPGLKREGSEPLLMGMVLRQDKSLKEKPTNVFPRGEDLRARKKAQVDAELKDAISALKKPNRALAVKEFADAVDKRASAGVNQVKKVKKPRTPSIVKATPANGRFKDVLAGDNARGQTSQSFEAIPPSSASMIPASTLPRKFTNALAAPPSSTPIRISATPARKPAAVSTFHTLQAIQETPGPILASSPIMARKAAPAPTQGQRASTQLLSIPQEAIDHFPSSPGLPALFETPVNPKFHKTATAINDSPIRSKLFTLAPAQQKQKEKEAPPPGTLGQTVLTKETASIYAQLGWDDDDDII